MSTKGFKLIFDYIRKTISNMAEGVLDGKCDADPAMVNSYNCEFCDYASVCLSKRDKGKSKKASGNNETALNQMESDLKNGLRGDESNADMD